MANRLNCYAPYFIVSMQFDLASQLFVHLLKDLPLSYLAIEPCSYSAVEHRHGYYFSCGRLIKTDVNKCRRSVVIALVFLDTFLMILQHALELVGGSLLVGQETTMKSIHF